MTVQQVQEMIVELSVAERLQIARWLNELALPNDEVTSSSIDKDVSENEQVDGHDATKNGSTQSDPTNRNNLTRASSVPQSDVDEQVAANEREIIDNEVQAFRVIHSQLLEQIPGQYAAIHQGALIDHDEDQFTLYMRMQEKYKDTPILIRQVLSTPDRDIVIRSPRFEHA